MADTKEEQSILQAALAAFAFTPEDIKRLAELLYRGNIAAFVAAYRASAEMLGISVPDHQEPDDTTLRELTEAAYASAESIAETYAEDMRGPAESFLTDWQQNHSSLDGSKAALYVYLHQWTKDRAEWKSLQIAKYETGQAARGGIRALMQDWRDEKGISGADGQPETFKVVVLPSSAKEPYCQQFMGKLFDLEDFDLVAGYFPAHGGCEHAAWVIPM